MKPGLRGSKVDDHMSGWKHAQHFFPFTISDSVMGESLAASGCIATGGNRCFFIYFFFS